MNIALPFSNESIAIYCCQIKNNPFNHRTTENSIANRRGIRSEWRPLCAKNHLLVDFHDGPVHPYGQMRTWPNAVTREFCHAQLDGHHVFVPKTFVTTVFVNMVAGPIDMNNGRCLGSKAGRLQAR